MGIFEVTHSMVRFISPGPSIASRVLLCSLVMDQPQRFQAEFELRHRECYNSHLPEPTAPHCQYENHFILSTRTGTQSYSTYSERFFLFFSSCHCCRPLSAAFTFRPNVFLTLVPLIHHYLASQTDRKQSHPCEVITLSLTRLKSRQELSNTSSITTQEGHRRQFLNASLGDRGRLDRKLFAEDRALETFLGGRQRPAKGIGG